LHQPDAVDAAIRTWCTNYLAEMLKLPPAEINPDVRFARLGLDSASAIFLVTALEEWLGIELSAELVFEHQTVADVARYLARLPQVAGKLQRAT
jgi:acyl carrier protein